MDDVLVDVADQVATVTINRPEVRNALRTRTYIELAETFVDLADRAEVGVIVLRGAGEKAFCSGGDVKDQAGRTPEVARSHLRRVLALGQAMRGCGKPVIAAVRGYCVGGGHELHLMADLTISAEDGVFGQVGPRVGGVPIWGATQTLPLVVGEKRAREIVYTTRFYSASEAEAMGLINRVVPVDEFEEAVATFCDELLSKSSQSLRIAKISMNYATDAMWPAFSHGAELLSMMYGTDEQREGAQAFLEKRPPDYRRLRHELAEREQ